MCLEPCQKSLQTLWPVGMPCSHHGSIIPFHISVSLRVSNIHATRTRIFNIKAKEPSQTRLLRRQVIRDLKYPSYKGLKGPSSPDVKKLWPTEWPSGFVNKVLLECSHALQSVLPTAASHENSRVEQLQQRPCGLQSLKYLHSGPLRASADLCSLPKPSC